MKEIEEKKATIIGVLEKHGVRKASLFGSIVRREATEESDIDLLVEFEGKKSLLDLARLEIELEQILGKKIDILTYKSLHPLLRDKILKEQEVLME
jgi:hypothetical protein